MNKSGGFFGSLWFLGWLFTIGFGHLVWWKIIVGIFIWPFFLGENIGWIVGT